MEGERVGRRGRQRERKLFREQRNGQDEPRPPKKNLCAGKDLDVYGNWLSTRDDPKWSDMSFIGHEKEEKRERWATSAKQAGRIIVHCRQAPLATISVAYDRVRRIDGCKCCERRRKDAHGGRYESLRGCETDAALCAEIIPLFKEGRSL